MGSLFNDLTINQHKDSIRFFHGTESVRDDHGGPASNEALEGRLKGSLRFGVKGRSGLIQYQKRGIFQ